MEGDERVKRWRGRARGQATLEFAFAAPLFLLCLLGTIDAALWAVQTSAAVSAVEEGARVAASAVNGPLAPSPPNARDITSSVESQLKNALFATSVRPWPRSCPATPGDVEALFGPRVVAVCVHENQPPACTTPPAGVQPPYPLYCADSPTVSVQVIGFMASLVPPSFGLGWRGGEIPLDIGATTHTLRFAP